MSFIWLLSSLSCPHLLWLLPSHEKKTKKTRLEECSALQDRWFHQYSQARGAHVLKKSNRVDDKDKRWEEGETLYQGKCLSGAISMKAVCTLKSRWVTASQQDRKESKLGQYSNVELSFIEKHKKSLGIYVTQRRTLAVILLIQSVSLVLKTQKDLCPTDVPSQTAGIIFQSSLEISNTCF